MPKINDFAKIIRKKQKNQKFDENLTKFDKFSTETKKSTKN